MISSPITARVIRRPAYDNTFHDWQRWYVRNESRLVEYYAELTLYTERPAEDDFVEFAMCQFDLAMARRADGECTLLKRQAG